jgi:hypothetical protein
VRGQEDLAKQGDLPQLIPLSWSLLLAVVLAYLVLHLYTSALLTQSDLALKIKTPNFLSSDTNMAHMGDRDRFASSITTVI